MLDEDGVGVWCATRSKRLSGTAPYRKTCSCSTTDIGRYHVDTTVPEFIADLVSSLPIEALVELIATAYVDRRWMVGDLLVAFTRIGRPQFVEAFEVVRMEYVPSRPNDALPEIAVAFVRS